jgi:hypothetical protein
MKHKETLLGIAACALCFSSAQAALQLDWQNETSPSSPPAGVSAPPAGITYQTENVGASVSDGFSVTAVQSKAVSGFGAAGLAKFRAASLSPDDNRSPDAASGRVFAGTGGSCAISPGGISGSISSAGITFSLSGADGDNNGNSTAAIGGVPLNGLIIAPVPEPITYALPLFGLVFIGGTAGRFYLRRRQQARFTESKA